MFLKLFKGAQPALFVFVPVFAVLLWMKYLILPLDPVPGYEPNPMPFYALVRSWLEGYIWISRLIALLLLILVAFWLSRLNTKFIILGGRTLLHTFLYLLIVSAYLPVQQITPVLFASVFMVLCIEIMFGTFKQEGLALRYFEAALLVGISSLFHARSAFMLLIIWSGLVILRPFIWREWAFTVIGFALPYIFLFAIYYLSGEDIQSHWNLMRDNFLPDRGTLSGISNNDPRLFYLAFYGFGALMLITASFRMLRINQGLKIYVRKFYRLNFWIFIITLGVWIGFYSRSMDFIYLIAVPVTYVLTEYLYNIRSRTVGEIILTGLLSLYGLILVFN